MQNALTFDDVSLVPQYSEISTRSECCIKTNLTKNIQLNSPIVSSPMDTVTEVDMATAIAEQGGIGFIHRFVSPSVQSEMVRNVSDKGLLVGAAIGVRDYAKRIDLLVKAGISVLMIDVAHGHHKAVGDTISSIKNLYNVDVIAGNVCTYDGSRYIIDSGADCIRCGVGSGHSCSTRQKAAVGVPQLTAISNAYKAKIDSKSELCIMADGGVRYPADVAKAIAFGADTVMLGYLLSGTDESPGDFHTGNNWPVYDKYKIYRGSASVDSKTARNESSHVEGVSMMVPHKGSAIDIINGIHDGLRSCLSYMGFKKISDFRNKPWSYCQTTYSGQIEATPYGLNKCT
ncbi:MAG: Inositol-5-monophosphate dehydrogenase [Promethearchaeota archaeon]|nr:MAG: Inositol-5-monophosphate dehydrogenase [Candidatus Lokiarchaeota archaeon]